MLYKWKFYVFLVAVLCTSQQTHAQNQSYILKWKLASQDEAFANAVKVSSPGLNTSNWIPAIVPGTVFHAYVAAGKEQNPDYGDNIYRVDQAKYNRPFWYRTEFTTHRLPHSKRLWLKFNGVNKRAEIYINGYHLGTLKGLMQRGTYDITDKLLMGKPNAVAVLVIPPRHDPEHNHPLANWESPTYLSSGSWDWMPAVPGLNSGITDTVILSTTGPISIEDSYIHTDLPNLHIARLSVDVRLSNAGSKPVSGIIKVEITPGNINLISKRVTIDAKSSRVIKLTPAEYPQLKVKDPKLWWPNGYGGKADGTQHLYTANIQFAVNGAETSDAVTKQFGIRKIASDTTTLNGPMRLYINDVPVFVKGGNWGMSDYMLKVRGKHYDTRIRFHKEMNFNIIRNWTGEVTDEAFYQYCDKYGIMVWDDFWLNNLGGIDSLDMFRANAIEKVKKFRNHPSVVIWCGANEGVPEGNPDGRLSNAIKTAIAENEQDTRIYLPRSNAGVTNPSFSIHGGSKNLSGSGIWGNVDPKTYFTDPHNSYLFSADSYGMRSELGAATFVNIESFKRFMPKDYWVPPTPGAVNSKTNMWARHFFSTDPALGGGAEPVRYINDINQRYGKATSIEDFCRKAQLFNVETTKAMYEAWNDHMWKDASGLLMWMSQSAYPTMIWQTYDYYYDLTGAYFGVKAACEPIHIQWNAATNSIKVINNKNYAINSVTAKAEVYASNGKILPAYTLKKTLNVNATAVKEAFVVFNGEDKKLPQSGVCYLKLKLYNRSGALLSENFYWIGGTYLNYQALNQLPSVNGSLQVSNPVIKTATNGVDKVLTYIITNNSKQTAAFGIRAQLLNSKGEQILPAIFNDGYFALMQGEKKTLQVEVSAKALSSGYKLALTPYNM
ncbi:beta galactosidase jelly roll domain-containing protein [Mucilaginibacter sp. Bleaf8]|uniref:glycoside hydrolase family 2 protein n=1 Tax=Mucilaginibacter sp. Bleaf8 TaxID=2834430 RepID=UPI001BCB8695|nr:sugar-binding domain-containing protein [Mucilaginibacter sp. Bleaf8]MBS7564729.1 beta galactosidase jelly roll domain-containing protein [Mucilaginibacter sp. Bleaf8]